MWIHDDNSELRLYPISYILTKGKWDAYNREFGYRIAHDAFIKSKYVGWYCELCGSKSKPKARYTHTLIQRVKWHINGRCPYENRGKYTHDHKRVVVSF